MAAHRLLLVREWDEQMTGSGCCGRLGGERCELGDATTYRHVRDDMEAMGVVYRAVQADFPPEIVELTVVDPRNAVWLAPTIWRDARRRGMSRAEALRQVTRGISATAVVLDGRVLFHGDVPDPESALQAVYAELAAQDAASGGGQPVA